MDFETSPDTPGHRATSECNAWRSLELAVVGRRVPVRCRASDVGTSAKGKQIHRRLEVEKGGKTYVG